MIGWKTGTAIDLGAGSTTITELSVGTGKVTIRPEEDVYIEFTDSAGLAAAEDDIGVGNSTLLPADSVMTIEVPTYKFKALDKTIAGVDDSSKIMMLLKSSRACAVNYVEH